MKRLLFLLPLLLFAVVASYFLWGLDPARDPSAIPIQMVDRPVPPFELPPVDGVDRPGFSDTDLTSPAQDGGAAIRVVNVFASWCIPCRAEHPIITRLAGMHGIEVYGIDYQDRPEDAAKWLEELGNPYTAIGADRQGKVGVVWGIRGVPETYIVDGAGRIRHHHIGPITPDDLERVILPLIEELRS